MNYYLIRTLYGFNNQIWPRGKHEMFTIQPLCCSLFLRQVEIFPWENLEIETSYPKESNTTQSRVTLLNVHSNCMLKLSPSLNALCSRELSEFVTESPRGPRPIRSSATRGQRKRGKERERNQSRPTTQRNKRPDERRNKTRRTNGAT